MHGANHKYDPMSFLFILTNISKYKSQSGTSSRNVVYLVVCDIFVFSVVA